MYWILTAHSIKEILSDEHPMFLSYKIYGGNLKDSRGCVNKRYLDYMIETGAAKIITNPLEAYALKIQFEIGT